MNLYWFHREGRPFCPILVTYRTDLTLKPDNFRKFYNNDLNQRLKPSNCILLWISVAIAIFFLYVALHDLDWQAFFAALKRTHYINLPFIFFSISSNYFLRSLRWRVLLTQKKHLPAADIFLANMAGYLGNNILPARSGELIRAAYVSKQNNINASFALAAGLTERLVDVIALFIIGSVALSFAGLLTGPLQTALQAAASVGIIGLLVVFLLPHLENILVKIISLLPFLKENYKFSLTKFLLAFTKGLQSLHNGKRASIFILLTAIIWLIDWNYFRIFSPYP